MRACAWNVLLVILSVLAGSCGGGTADPPAPARVVSTGIQEVALSPEEQAASQIQTQPAALREEPDLMRVAGRIALADDRTWRVGVLSEGRVEIVRANLGDYVRKGQVLARMHSHLLHEARAQYQMSLSELNRLRAAAALAERNYDRMQTLLELKAASIQQTEQTRQELLNAQTALADGQIAVDRDRIHLEDNLGVPADLPLGGHNQGEHDENADLIPIIAPASGYVLTKNVTPGVTMQPSMDAFVIGELSQVWMLASVRQEDLGKLRVGQPVSITLRGVPDQSFPGKITNLGQELDPATRVMQVRITVNNPGNRLKPEMLATALIPVGDPKPQLVVPSEAVQQVNGQDAIFVRTAADRFAFRPIRIGEAAAGQTPVLEGLEPGEQVVVRGSFVLKSQLLRSALESQ